MEDQYAGEASMADRRGDSRLAADKYLQAVQAATNKLSDVRILSFTSYVWRFVWPPENESNDCDDDGPGYLPAEDKDLEVLLNSFLNNPDEPTIFRAYAAAALANSYHFDATGRRNVELAAIYARRCIQECIKARIEERNHVHHEPYGLGTVRLGDIIDRMRDTTAGLLELLEFPANAFASLLASLPYPAIGTSYGIYNKGVLAELFGDSTSMDQLARRLTVGGVACDCCGKKRDHADLCSLLCCDRCQMAYYCSAECQRRQWKEGGHKKACRKPGEFREGDAIRLDGLNATPQYNNCVGLAVRPPENSGNEERRWAVRTCEPNYLIEMLSIKESSMRRIRPADVKS